MGSVRNVMRLYRLLPFVTDRHFIRFVSLNGPKKREICFMMERIHSIFSMALKIQGKDFSRSEKGRLFTGSGPS
jgi:hypothetical protein